MYPSLLVPKDEPGWCFDCGAVSSIHLLLGRQPSTWASPWFYSWWVPLIHDDLCPHVMCFTTDVTGRAGRAVMALTHTIPYHPMLIFKSAAGY